MQFYFIKKPLTMQRNIFLTGIIICAIACNNESKPGTTGDSTTAKAAVPENSFSLSAGGCSDLYLFKKGTVIEAISYDKNGEETTRQSSTVLNVAAADNGVTAEVEMKSMGTDKKEKSFIGKYSCDGKNIYVDLTSVFASMDAKGAKIEGDPISFPISVSEGETLPDVTYTMTMSMGGKQMKTTVHMKERKVGAREKITTPAGTFDCYRISSTSEAEVDVEGMDEKMKKIMESMKSTMPKQSFVIFYDPSVTIVKMEMYSDNKLISHTDVVSIK
jgi:hypothetical protein